MKPTIGRIVHVRQETLDSEPVCSAAIVTGRIQEVGEDKYVFAAAVFPVNGDLNNAARRAAVGSATWHDPRECPNEQS